jgi:uncharacterized protein
MPRFLPVVLVGLAGGVASGLFGIGGGLVFVPGLVLLLGFQQHRAHATSSLAVVITSAVGATRFFAGGAADISVGVLLAAGAIVGAFIGATSMRRVPSKWLKLLFAIVATAAAIKLIFGVTAGESSSLRMSVSLGVAMILIGVGTGTLMSMLGLGGGLVYVPLLSIVFGLGQKIAQGTSLVAIVPTQLTAALVHFRAGRIDTPVALTMGGAGVVGTLFGAQVAFSIPASTLRILFSVLLVAAGALQVFKPDEQPETRAG